MSACGMVDSFPTIRAMIRRARATHRSEHVAPHDERTCVCHALLGKLVVGAGCATITTSHLHEEPRCHQPFVQFFTAFTEWLFFCLVGSGAVAVERNCKAVYDESWHRSDVASATSGLCQKLCTWCTNCNQSLDGFAARLYITKQL